MSKLLLSWSLILSFLFMLPAADAKKAKKKAPKNQETPSLFAPGASEVSGTAGVRGLGVKDDTKKGWTTKKKKKNTGPFGDR